MAMQSINRLQLGVFVTIGLVLFAVAVYYIGNKQNMFGDTITLSTTFRNVNGLQSGNNVRYSGINIGTVSDLIITSDTTVQVDMIIEKEASQHIRKDAIATVSSDGLVGNMMIGILPTVNSADFIEDGDFIPSFSRIGAEDMLQTLNVTNENAALLTADLLKITDGIIEKKGTLGMLLYDSTIAKDFQMTLKNLRSTTWQINQASTKINATLNDLDRSDGLLAQITSDTLVFKKLDETMNNLQFASDELTKITGRLNGIVGDIKTEEGALQTIIYDTAFMQDLKQSMHNINEGTAKFSENMEALKHNFLTRKYFKKKAKKGE